MKAIRSLQNKRKVALKAKQRNFHLESSILKCASSIFPFCLKYPHLLVLLFARCLPFILVFMKYQISYRPSRIERGFLWY